MEKDKFQPIVMPCTKEQFESLVPILEKNNIIYNKYQGSFNGIVNNFNGNNNYVGKIINFTNTHHHNKMGNRKYYQRFNRKIFLKSLGIIEEPEFVLPEKWCVKSNNYQELEIITKHFYGYLLRIDPKSYVTKNGLDNRPGHSNYNFWNYTEITFEQFQKYVLKQESNLKNQSVTNKQTKMRNTTIAELPETPGKFNKGDLVKDSNKGSTQIYIVTETSPTTCDLLCIHPLTVYGMTQTSVRKIHLSLFKGELTLEQ